jgi:hypothetical protein
MTTLQFHGSRASTNGNMIMNSSATAAATSARAWRTFAGRRPGSRRQIQSYMHSAGHDRRRAGSPRTGSVQLSEDHQPLSRGEARMARGNGEQGLSRAYPRSLRNRVDDVESARRDDRPPGHPVDVPPGCRLQHQRIARLKPVQMPERCAVGGAVAGDDEVARLSWQGRSRIVAGPLRRSAVCTPSTTTGA